MLLDGDLPLTMGGGIGQSRLCMLLLGKAHVGEVQVSLWDDATVQACRKAGVELLYTLDKPLPIVILLLKFPLV